MIKCYICATQEVHNFNQCLSADCSCPCVKQIYKMKTNGRIDGIKPVHPKFLHIDNVEIKDLPDLSSEVSRFGKIKKSEWLPKKRDRRFKKKR